MTAVRSGHRRRLLAPEVVQSSAMDCGPATLKCLLDGFGVPVSYGRLREACQTDVDGTSIDTMEDIARQLGLETEQTVLPLDHLFLAEARALPAIVVVRFSNGLTHFVVVWRRHGPVLQLMDPATGRRWTSARSLLEEIYVHEIPIAAADWRAWVEGDEFLGTLRRRLANLRVSPSEAGRLIDAARADPGWRTFATLDAAVRMTDTLVHSGGLREGREASGALRAFWEQALGEPADSTRVLPAVYWFARGLPTNGEANGEERVLLRGAVLVRVLGRQEREGSANATEEGASNSGQGAGKLSPELTAALAERPPHPARELLNLMRSDGLLAPGVLAGALLIGAGAVVFEAVLLRGLFDLGRDLTLAGQRLGAMLGILALAGAVLLLEVPVAGMGLRLGRRLEIRLRVAFLEKIPRLVDRYFQSRLISDMAERSHTVQTLRELPKVGARFLRAAFELMFTALGIAWLDPASAPVALLATSTALVLPLLTNPCLTERDLRIRTHVGALARFYLDAMLGLVPIRTHGAERAVRSEHESLLVEWVRAGFGLQRTAVLVEGLQTFVGMAFAVWLLLGYLARNADAGGVLLLVYWALNLPFLAQEAAMFARQYPALRSVTLRLLEPLAAPEQENAGAQVPARRIESGDRAVARPPPSTSFAHSHQVSRPHEASSSAVTESAESPLLGGWETSVLGGTNRVHHHGQPGELEPEGDDPRTTEAAVTPAAIVLSDVSVRAGGHLILEQVNVRIAAGEQVAVVGPSGAGKSSFVGLLLGWHRPAGGEVLVDGSPLDGRRLEQLRRHTAWVDPAVQLWNRSLLENLRYGANGDAGSRMGWIVQQADLLRVLEKLPDGLQTRLGEGGGLVSGGEGQRVRFGRGLLRENTRLVILDEPFRGLDREQRRLLTERARAHWQGVTLLCITHDVGETQRFDRVLVIESGRLVEDGSPVALAQSPDSRYGALLAAEKAVREQLWSGDLWRRQWLEGGRCRELTRGKEALP